MEDHAAEVFHHYGVHLSSSCLSKILNLRSEERRVGKGTDIKHEVPLFTVILLWVPALALLINMLLFSRSGFMEENTVEVFHHYGVHLSSSFLI